MSTSGANEVIRKIKTGIETGNMEDVVQQLPRLPIAFLPKDQSNLLLAMFVNATNSCQILRYIIDFFDQERIRVDPLPANTELFTNLHVHPDVLKFVIQAYPEKTTMDYFFDLINSIDDELALQTAIVLTKYFPELNRETWSRLCELTEAFEGEEYHNPLLRNFFELKLEEWNAIMEPPEYIRGFPEVPFGRNIGKNVLGKNALGS